MKTKMEFYVFVRAIQGLSGGKNWNSGKTKSFAIMTHAAIPGDCIDRVTSQNGEQVHFESLETPRRAPLVDVENELAKPAAAAAFLFLHRRT